MSALYNSNFDQMGPEIASWHAYCTMLTFTYAEVFALTCCEGQPYGAVNISTITIELFQPYYASNMLF